MSAVTDAISGEYAAIYAYGVLGPHLSGSARAMAVQAEADHRNLRDSLLETVASPPPPLDNYAVPFPVTDRTTAIALAVRVEERCAALWRAAVTEADVASREKPLTSMTGAALRAAAWRRAGGARPGTVAFPGQ